MHRKMRVTIRLLVLILGIAAIPPSLMAQSIMRPPDTGASFTLESLRPHLDYDEYKFPTAGIFFTYRGEQKKGNRFILEVPLAFAKSRYTDPGIALGNPYVGFELGSADSPGFFDLGIRLPLTGKEYNSAKIIGLFSDFNQRMGAYTQESVWLKGGANYRNINDEGFSVRLRSGLTVWIPTKNTEYRDTEFLMQFSAQMSQTLGKVTLWGAFGGNYYISEKDIDFEDRVTSDLGIGVTLNLGGVQPGLCISVPLDKDMQDILNSVVGFQVSFMLGS